MSVSENCLSTLEQLQRDRALNSHMQASEQCSGITWNFPRTKQLGTLCSSTDRAPTKPFLSCVAANFQTAEVLGVHKPSSARCKRDFGVPSPYSTICSLRTTCKEPRTSSTFYCSMFAYSTNLLSNAARINDIDPVHTPRAGRLYPQHRQPYTTCYQTRLRSKRTSDLPTRLSG
jgi:hypothetical protein